MFQILHRIINIMLKTRKVTKTCSRSKKNLNFGNLSISLLWLAYCGSILSFFGIFFPPQKKVKFDLHTLIVRFSSCSSTIYIMSDTEQPHLCEYFLKYTPYTKGQYGFLLFDGHDLQRFLMGFGWSKDTNM